MNINPITPGRADFHVVPTQGHWAVKAEHLTAYSGHFDTQLEATAYAVKQARNSAALVIIHDSLGRFDKVWNYG
jgi:hypothetical protein